MAVAVPPLTDQKPRSAARTKQRCFNRKIREETEGQQCISNGCLLEDEKNYMFRPLLAIIRFLMRKNCML